MLIAYIKYFEIFIKKSSHKENSRTRLFHKSKEEIIPIIDHCFLKTEEALYETDVTLIAKPDRDIISKENYRPLPIMNTDTNILNNI